MDNTRQTLREYDENKDLLMLQHWWHQHHGNDFRPGYVPKAAFIVTIDGFEAGFFGMCPMTPDFAYFAFPLVNPHLPDNIRDMAVDFMIDCAKLWTADHGMTIVYISIRGEKFLSRLREKQFVAGEDGCQHMFCKVGEIL